MDLSKQKQNEAKKLGVTTQQLVMADLMAIGYSDTDAYTVAYPENAALSVQQNTGIRTTIIESSKFRKLLEGRSTRVKDGIATPMQLDDVELVGTEEVLKEILRSAKQQPIGSKERADLYARYNDIRKESEQAGYGGIEDVKFFFPLKCNQCPLLYAYNEEMKKQGKKDIRPVEMNRVVKVAEKIIRVAMESE